MSVRTELGGIQFKSQEFQHPGNSDLDVYCIKEKILKEICFVPVSNLMVEVEAFIQTSSHAS
jgi:hypothetical protein